MIPIQSIFFIISISCLFSNSDASFASKSSLIPFKFSKQSKPVIHLGGLNDNLGFQPISGIQLQPTSNLLIGGLLSPRHNNNDLSIYYQIVIGYLPKWKLLKFSSNMVQIGMHRYRFSTFGDSRWFSFSILESTKIGILNLNLSWNRLFTQKWERNTVLISTKFNLLKNLSIEPGIITFFTPNIDYSAFLLFGILI